MLHAIVRSQNEALHFVGAANGHNLQTLLHYTRRVVSRRGSAMVTVRIQKADAPVWDRYALRWLWQMADAGVRVEFEVEPSSRPAANSLDMTRQPGGFDAVTRRAGRAGRQPGLDMGR